MGRTSMNNSRPSPVYHYIPRCSAPGCARAATYKIAAVWISGQLAELKNYGLACDGHRQELFEQARDRRARLEPSYDESIGEVTVYAFDPEALDADLVALSDLVG
jgi:hypothetical protein